MLTLSHAMIAEFLERQDGPPLADWLIEQGATPYEVALLYAGRPPHHTDGIGQECLALWLECRGDVEQARQVRAFEVREDEDRAPASWRVKGHPAPASHPTPERARRELMRTVLSMPWAAGLVIRLSTS